MEKKLDDGEFWLPSQFLTDDFGSGFNPFGTQSDLSSPVESVIGSVDTESDEEDYITGLTQKMAHSALHESGFGYGNTKGWSLSGSPQSTLYRCKQGSSHGRPNCPSQVSSPPPVNQSDRAFDQFYATAGEVARIRMMEEVTGLYHSKTGLWGIAEKNSRVPVAPKYLNQPSLSYQQLQIAQFQRLKQQQIMKQGQGVFVQYPVNQNHQQLAQSRGQNGASRPMNSSISSWPMLQQSQFHQQPSSGMRAVFLGNPDPKRECAGTGVFLPRRIGTQTETRKKPGCSTVLLPDRVVQALNLNLEAVDVRQQNLVQARSGSTPSGGSRYPNNMAVAQPRHNLRSGNTYSQPATMSQELLLPQDWTY
ncbi:uncharacterized protein LOC129877560 [Solanum dulcamara]|uniref:uncharacterized protein LOC129877560 n=1 Tax=Solanum dulcamara TaxID=45834 RepID=UPI0024855B13|nr:uncharacterized protein LOC129877560 [Solanum dulcamara]